MEKLSVSIFKCPNCGAPMSFDAESGTFTCEYCGSVLTRQQLDTLTEQRKYVEAEPVTEGAPADPSQQASLKEYICPSCGAQIVTNELTAATFCRYCGSPTIIENNLQGEFKPDLMIPFKVSKQQVEGIFAKWCHKGAFTPKGFYSKEQMERITGTYVPFWMYDCDVDLYMEGTGETSSTHRSGDYLITTHRKFRFARNGSFRFRKIPADASRKMDDDMMDKVEPYDYRDLKMFDAAYLSGFAAEKYDVDSPEAFPRVDERMSKAAEDKVNTTIGRYENRSITVKNKHYTMAHGYYAMLPVWLFTYKYKDKDYTFMVNGQTGKVVGEPPVSKLKVLLQGGILAAILWIIGMGVMIL